MADSICLELERQGGAALIGDVFVFLQIAVPEPLDARVESETQVFCGFVVGAGIDREQAVIVRQRERRSFYGVSQGRGPGDAVRE
jgi:hypothetical protein